MRLAKRLDDKELDWAQSSTDRRGTELVYHQGERSWTPPTHQHLADTFEKAVLKSPHPVKCQRGAKEASLKVGAEAKRVYSIPQMDGSQTRFLVKPYFQPRGKNWAQFYGPNPIGGWNEMTSQALYHSAGIGHLHQRVHVFHAEDQAGRSRPMLAIHLEPDHKSVGNVPLKNLRTPELAGDARKMAVMDYLVNHLDRHTDNLMHGPSGKLLSIDHSFTMGYSMTAPMARDSSDRTDRFDEYHGEAAHDIVSPLFARDIPMANQHAHAEQAYKPTLAWWSTVGPQVRKTLEERVQMLKDPRHREHVLQNFRVRADHLDMAAAGKVRLLGTRVPLIGL